MPALNDDVCKDGDNFSWRGVLLDLIANWNKFLRETPLSMGLFIGKDAIFEGFKIETHKGSEIVVLDYDFEILGADIVDLGWVILIPREGESLSIYRRLTAKEARIEHERTLHYFLKTIYGDSEIFLK